MDVIARPAGAFVIRGDDVVWRPAVDVNRVIVGGQIVAVVALLVVRSIARARAVRRAERDDGGQARHPS
jgi:hypothetical protein